MIDPPKMTAYPLHQARPLLPLSVCSALLNQDAKSIIADCESGRFAYAWDISANASRNREIRVWNLSLAAVLQQQSQPRMSARQVLDWFIPATRGLRGVELQRVLSCSPNLIHDLEVGKLIQVGRPRTQPVGPNASNLYTHDSICEFLASRFIGLKPALN